MARLNLLFASMLAFVSYLKRKKKADKKTEVRLNDCVAHLHGKVYSGLTVFLVVLLKFTSFC